ncbi:dihydroorotate dehydrogenase B catalytic subunit [Candidatus Heimdallarchaeota archaeon B3_Heim]|nr:MAG: dihydroorotate dehydrogenase B catalytic subunit [Candidatus Heimdallarchaeota archaeon B3_Heim]
MTELQTLIGTVRIRNPIILSSGIWGSTYSTLNRAYKEGFGAVTTKSVGLNPRKGHPNPSVIYIPEIKSILNAVGLANPGYDAFSEELREINHEVKYSVSIFGSSSTEFQQIIQHMDNNLTGNTPIAYELNLSCPHAKKVGIAVGTDPNIVYTIVEACKVRTKVPIWVKLTPNITNIKSVAESAISAGADAIVAINTIKAMMIDIHIKKPVLGNISGGLSGQAIKPIGVRVIYDLYERFGSEIPLVGVGGISSWQDAIEYILAGATAIQIGSALIDYDAPQTLVHNILNGLNEYLSREGKSFSQLRGLAHE